MIRLLLVEVPELAEDDRAFARVVEALAAVCPWIDPVRPGVATLPIRGPARYFGDERAVLARVVEVVAEFTGVPARLGVAEGLFAAGPAARLHHVDLGEAGVVVPPGETPAFLVPWPVAVLGEPDLAEVLVRLGVRTLGDLAALPTADVLARFGTVGARCHRAAAGRDGELPGLRSPGLSARLVALLGRELAPAEHQPGFWGGAGAADERAAVSLTALQRRLGPDAVLVPVLAGGRGPSDRCRLVPWRPDADPPEDPDEPLPWPGRLPPPAPARVADRPAELVDAHGSAVGVTARGLLTAAPARLSVAGGPWAPVAGWSAPWPVEEWRAGRRAARLQVVTAEAAYLLLLERRRWRVEATYD